MKSVEGFVKSFANRCILIPSEQNEGRCSNTELHRIRRAFWWSCEIYEWHIMRRMNKRYGVLEHAAHYVSAAPRSLVDPGKNWICRDEEEYWRWQRGFCISPDRKFNNWQLRELSTVREFLIDEVNNFQLDRKRSLAVLPP